MSTSQDGKTSGTCCICLDSLNTPGLGQQTLGCGHVLHEKCVNDMRRHGSKSFCPLCRAELDELTPVQHMYEEAILLSIRGSYQEGFQKLSQVLDVQPDHAEANALMGKFFDLGHGVRKDPCQAVEYYEAAIRLGSQQNVLNNLGQIYKSQGKQKQAERLFSEAHHNHNCTSATFNLAVMSKEVGNTKRAEELYWIAHRNGHGVATYNLANLKREQGHFKIAEELYLQVIHHLPYGEIWELQQQEHRQDLIGGAMNNLGIIYCQQGKLNQAREMLMRALRNGKIEALSGMLLIIAKMRSQRGKEAAHNWIMEAATSKREVQVISLLISKDSDSKDSDSGAPRFNRGSEVRIHGLHSTAGQLLNGCDGTVLGHDIATGRIQVAVQGAGNKLIKEANLTKLAPSLSSEVANQTRAASDSSTLSTLPVSKVEDLEEGLQASLRHAAESAAVHDAPLMDAIMRSAKDGHSVTVVILEFSRNEEWFRRVLLESEELEECRQALREACLSPELPSGAKCFVSPNMFEAVVQALREQGIKTGKRHVIVSTELEDIVKHVVEVGRQSVSRRERGSFKMKVRSEVDVTLGAKLHQSSGVGANPFVLIKRTFIDVKLPNSMRSDSSQRPVTV